MNTAQLHHFSDASEDGYRVVTYLLLHDINSQVHVTFVMGKARVAPLKPVSIPRKSNGFVVENRTVYVPPRHCLLDGQYLCTEIYQKLSF